MRVGSAGWTRASLSYHIEWVLFCLRACSPPQMHGVALQGWGLGCCASALSHITTAAPTVTAKTQVGGGCCGAGTMADVLPHGRLLGACLCRLLVADGLKDVARCDVDGSAAV